MPNTHMMRVQVESEKKARKEERESGEEDVEKKRFIASQSLSRTPASCLFT